MPELRIASWNVNSIRRRIDLVRRFARKYAPDVLCLQETKVSDGLFPVDAVRRMGFEGLAINGQKGHHGVATLTRCPLRHSYTHVLYGDDDSRHVAVALGGTFAGFEIHNFYVPAGGDVPDPNTNDKFAYKLTYLDRMAQWMQRWPDPEHARRIVVGDLNVAPLENDVWDHNKLLRVVTHTPVEVERLAAVQRSHGWVDVAREVVPAENKLYTWWSYRARDWRRVDKGRRLDHIWVSPALYEGIESFHVAKEVRSWKRASDHAPVVTTVLLD